MKDRPREMNKNRLLISRYLDGELEADEVAELAEALQTDIVAIEWLVISTFIHSQLLSWLDQEREHEHAVAAPFGRRATRPDTVGSSAIKPLRETPDKSPSLYQIQHPRAVRLMPRLRSRAQLLPPLSWRPAFPPSAISSPRGRCLSVN